MSIWGDTYQDKHPYDIVVYIESYNKEEGIVYFDFSDSNGYNLFNEYLGTNSNFYQEAKPSIVCLSNYFQRRIQENTYYAIKRDIIFEWREQQSILIIEDSFLLGYTIENQNNNSENTIFHTSISAKDFDNSFLFYGQEGRLGKVRIPEPIRVKVKKVGQGSWNEIYGNDNLEIVYDIGTSMDAKKDKVRCLIDEISDQYKQANPNLIISHWDVDHYHVLCGMTDSELANFNCVIFRDAPPNLTSRVVYNRFMGLLDRKKILSLRCEPKDKKKKRLLEPITPIGSAVMIYNGQECKDRNISCIVVTVSTLNSSVILSADSHYDQISNYILPNLVAPKHYLIVPHHGGKAGKFIYNIHTGVKPIEAVISVGKNSYGHPLEIYKNALIKKGFSIQQTNFKGDIILYL